MIVALDQCFVVYLKAFSVYLCIYNVSVEIIISKVPCRRTGVFPAGSGSVLSCH